MKSIVLSLFAPLMAVVFCISTPCMADEVDFSNMVQRSIELMQREKWEEALQLNQKAVDQYGLFEAMRTWGPLFGTIYYRKGICELKLEKWDDAMKSFKICYRDFPNAVDAMSHNNFRYLALLRWADAAMGAEDWEEAIRLMRKFLKEREQPGERFSPEKFHTNMAKCYEKLGRNEERDKALEALRKYKEQKNKP